MKNKSKNHKSTNRFKFTSFADRVNDIDVRHAALYHLDHANKDAPSENQTYFNNAYLKWRVLNLTTEYVNFSKKIGGIVTLPQLLHQKDDIVNLLIENLEKATVLNLQPLLEIVVVLAKDLQEDFYQYFPRFLETLIRLLNTKEPEQLEWTLLCLAFLFKSLRTFLKRDISIIFEAVLPLLSESMPWYVNNFAAESFAFVARDIKDKKKFLHILVKTVTTKKNGIVGCGRLLFEVFRGVGDQFHSCTKTFLNFLLESLNDKSLNRKILFDILTQTIEDMLQVIHPKNSEVFWSTILNNSTLYLNLYNQNKESDALEYILKLTGQAIEHSDGAFLTNPLPLLVLIIQLLESDLLESTLSITSQLSVLVLLSKHTNMQHEDAVSLVRKMLSVPHRLIVIDFVKNIIDCPSFDIIILPHFLSKIDNFDTNIIEVLSKVCVTKSPLCKSGVELYSWVKYPIDFESKVDSYTNKLFEALIQDVSKIIESPDECVCSLICLPHIKNLNRAKTQHILEDLLSKVIEFIKYINNSIDGKTIPADNVKVLRNALFVLSITLETAVHTVEMKDFDEYCSKKGLIEALQPHLCNPELITTLSTLDLYLTMCHRQKTLDLSIMEKLKECINKNLISPFHDVRLLTTHICSLFEEKIQKLKSGTISNKDNVQHDLDGNSRMKEKFEVFSLCYSIESLPLSVNDYREQLVSVSKMTHNSTQFQLCSGTSYECFALRYALGFLNVNFNLLWGPVKSFILTFANGMSPSQFWEVFYPCLVQATKDVRDGFHISDPKEIFHGQLDFLNSTFNSYYSISDKPDYSLYRIRLWEILYEAPNICENKNRDITPLFLDFLQIEFENYQQANVLNDSTLVDADSAETIDEPELDEADDDDDGIEKEENKRTMTKTTYDTLIALLKVYTNIQNPKAMFMERKLHNIYSDFLMHKNPIIQKLALDCVMKYKNKHLTPYKEHLYNLVDGKKFKDELRTFKIQTGEDGIRLDDRQEVIPVILRITFSKMITNVGIDKKGGSQMRRSLVMRFLSGCEEAELISFTSLAFKILEPYLDLELSELSDRISDTVDELISVPPKRLFGALQLADTMREQFTRPGQEGLMLRLLKILLCIGCAINELLRKSNLMSGYSKILRDIRNRCVLSIARFFQQFEKYEWSFENNIQPIYDIFIWPLIEKLPTEGVYSPTPLLKLFNVWSQIPRLHPLFNVCNSPRSNLTPVYFCLELLKSNKIHHTVNEMLIQILDKLVTLEVDEETKILEIPSVYSVTFDKSYISKLKLTEQLNFGSSILIPHICTLVDILKAKFENVNPKKLQKRELTIISRVTEMVYEPKDVDRLLQFSLPILINRIGQNSTEDTLEASIIALTTLLSKSTNPNQHIRLITPLFSKVIPAAPRKALCKVLEVLSDSDETIQTMASIISEMNAPDEKWIEQPDFEKRINAFKRIYQLSESNSISAELGALILHNCFFTIRYNNDLSLRNSSIACLQKITPKLILQYKDSSNKDYLIRDSVILLIRNSLKVDNDVLKMEGIALLGEIVRECSEANPMFKELLPLANKSNKEIDFFENLQHLQFHRKIRALQRFCNHVKESPNVPSHKTLTQFIIPLASQFICSEKYTPKYALVDAAIDVIGAVCHLLPWRQYEAILKFYVGKLQTATDYQKQLIKLVCVVLDAFHFDLSKADSLEASNEIEKSTPLNQPAEEKYEDLEIPVDGDELEEVTKTQAETLPFQRMYTLSPSSAKRVVNTINEILTRLEWNSSQIMEHESSHKKVKKGGNSRREAEEKLRLPMALAVVKLLQKLPQPMLLNNILSVFIKVCNFLKSPMIGVRSTTRDIISKIMLTVGPIYLETLLSHLSTLLTRGIHVHILISTVHTVLITLKDSFTPGEMDDHVRNILKVCLNDLFGKASEEKEVVKLGHKAPEAKPSMKSFSTLRIVGQNISESSMTDLIKPFKETAETSHSKRTILKVQNALQNISLGLSDNTNISIGSLLSLLYDVFSGTVNRFQNVGQKRKIVNEREERYKRLKPDCLIITPDPKSKSGRIQKIIKVSSQANYHVVTEFALNLLHAILQKDKISEGEYNEHVDKCLPYLLQALKSQQVKVSTLALKCITSLWSKKFMLPTMKNEIENFSSAIFQILHKYGTSGISKKDDNFHLVANAFKAVTALIRDVKYHTINSDQMKALLLYAEHDINDCERQATAFSLLKTIISAKYKIPEIHDIMKKVANISILSENPRAREESRIVMLVFIMNYPLQKKLGQHIQFYLSQLEYELDHGRLSAIKMLRTLIEKLYVELLCEHASVMYISMGTRLVNDPSTDCKVLIAECLEHLLQRVTVPKKNELFKINMTLFKSYKPPHVEMSALLCSRFVNVEKQNFKTRLEQLLPELADQLYEGDSNVGRFVKIKTQEKNISNNNIEAKDNSYIQVLILLNKICEVCPSMLNETKYIKYTDEISSNCQVLLAHSHSWVRFNAVKFLTISLEALNPSEVSDIVKGKKMADRVVFHSVEALRSLIFDLSAQLIPGSISSDMADMVCKTFMLLLNIAIHICGPETNKEGDDDTERITAFWILKILKSALNSEVTKAPGNTIIRMSIFKMLEEMLPKLEAENVISIAKVMLPCIVREMTKTDSSFDSIKSQADKVGMLISQSLGDIAYNELLARVQTKLNHKRMERKQKIAQEKLSNPEKAAKRKLSLKEKKKGYKKKKVDILKGRISNPKKHTHKTEVMDLS